MLAHLSLTAPPMKLVILFAPLYRLIEANCEDHFVLKEEDGYISVYNELTEDISNLVERTEIDVNLLREEDKYDLVNGIKIYGKEELNSLMEDFGS